MQTHEFDSLTQLDAATAAGLNLKPFAELAVPIERLKENGIRFTRDCDDLDAYDIALLSIEGGPQFAILRYDAAPPDTAALLVSPELFLSADNAALVTHIAAALHVPVQAFRWRSDGGEISAAA